MRTTTLPIGEVLPESARVFFQRRLEEIVGLAIVAFTAALGVALATWSIADPSLNHATDAPVHNALGAKGAIIADLVMQLIGISAIILLAPLGLLGWKIASHHRRTGGNKAGYIAYWLVGTVSAAAVASLLPTTDGWPLPTGLGGVVGDALVALPKRYFSSFGMAIAGVLYFSIAILALSASLGMGGPVANDPDELSDEPEPPATFMDRIERPSQPATEPRRKSFGDSKLAATVRWMRALFQQRAPVSAPSEHDIAGRQFDELGPASTHRAPRPEQIQPGHEEPASAFAGDAPRVARPAGKTRRGLFGSSDNAARSPAVPHAYAPPTINLLAAARKSGNGIAQDSLEQNARLLESVLEDFSVKGDIVSVFPGPVVTLYEFEPAPGIKSSRVIGLADDIARSMSAVSARVAVVPGRNAIGIELPNPRRETVYLRELIAAPDFTDTKHKLAIALGKTIGGEPVIVDLAKMPHLLVAGTTGSGKSVAINTMILSLLYRLKPHECRLIMVDPKMLE
ncbi:DNA translocase FtsK 4TM domain-containing protein, partial [Rhodoblastus sp.]|uniref:DNA translocase FtsK 4TM domain-containing protein n=1 Tax=Rhodoblastus sp. TaxID=1962975 RepID=UPI0035AE4A64